MALDRAAILAKKLDLPREEIDVPELGGTVFVQVLTAAKRDRMEADHNVRKDKHAQFRARFVALVACDETGNPLFTEADLPDLDQLPATALDPIVKAGMRLNGLGSEAEEETRKNS